METPACKLHAVEPWCCCWLCQSSYPYGHGGGGGGGEQRGGEACYTSYREYNMIDRDFVTSINSFYQILHGFRNNMLALKTSSFVMLVG